MPWIAETANSPNSCVIVLVSSYITLFSARCLFSCQIQHQIYQIFVQCVCQISEQIIMYVSTTAVRCWWGHQCTVLATDYYHLWWMWQLDTLRVTLPLLWPYPFLLSLCFGSGCNWSNAYLKHVIVKYSLQSLQLALYQFNRYAIS
jgi:hypothetical protein